MPAAYKTPGVYIVEKNAFPPSIVAVETAVPAFVGYTEISDNKGQALLNTPFKITSMNEFRTYFGGPPPVTFAIKPTVAPATSPPTTASAPIPAKDFTVGTTDYYLEQQGSRFLLYYSMLHFFQNGGGPCWIVSVGGFKTPAGVQTVIAYDDLKTGIDSLLLEEEPTMLVIPDAVRLGSFDDCIKLQQQMLDHCGNVMKNRFAILDIYDGFKALQDPPAPFAIDAFRGALGVNNLNYGAAYYPWLNTLVVEDRDLGYQDFIDPARATVSARTLVSILTPTDADALTAWNSTMVIAANPNISPPQAEVSISDFIKNTSLVAPDADTQALITQVNQSLIATSATFKSMIAAATRKLNLLPPSAAMAGIYTFVDNNRGVWKAPANVSVNSVVSPAVSLSQYDQRDLNVTPMGKSINAIRTFIGEGVLVWGARTLDGNSLDWRYINVRRTMIFLEESCRLAAKRMVFEPNVEGTWVTVKSMIENFLNSIWRQGGLAGAVPEDAYSVHVGLGDTMTADDILEGLLKVTVLVAVSHPAEFIEITFQQEQQKS